MVVGMYGATNLRASEEKKRLLSQPKELNKTLLAKGVREFLDYFPTVVRWLTQIVEDKETIAMMKKEYSTIKADIDHNYKKSIEFPPTFHMKMVDSGPDSDDEVLTLRRSRSRDIVEDVSKNSPPAAKKETRHMLHKVYKSSFKRIEKFSDIFEQARTRFLKAYTEGEKAWQERDILAAYEAMCIAQGQAKRALYCLTQYKEEKMTINAFSDCTMSEGYSSGSCAENEDREEMPVVKEVNEDSSNNEEHSNSAYENIEDEKDTGCETRPETP